MRNLIRKILKEEVENNYDLVDKGIDMVISILNKKYPFIVGWELSGEYDESKYFIYIDLKVDVNKVKEYYNLPFKYFYEKYPDAIETAIATKEKFAYPTSILDIESIDLDPWTESKSITSFAEEMYELVPDEYKMKEERENIFGKIDVHNKEINMSYYIFVR